MQEGRQDKTEIETTSALRHFPPTTSLYVIPLQHPLNSTFIYTMANMIKMAFLNPNELHNVADRMHPIIKSVQIELATRATKPLQDEPFMAPLLNDGMDDRIRGMLP